MDFSDFDVAMKALPEIPAGSVVGTAVSGGPDSMVLLWLLSQHAVAKDFSIHAYTVDHGLRVESAEEARKVCAWVKDWPRVTHSILKWEGDKPETRILEEARAARYALMAQEMKNAGAQYLFIAHHQDDQAETFLIRLAKGSGLDGLSCMRSAQPTEHGITLLRPLLDVSKEELIALARENSIPYVEDPTNKNEDYLRPRLRAAKAALEEEGLTAKRLATTAARMARARDALDDLSHDLFTMALVEQSAEGFVFDYKTLHAAHEELALRVILSAMDKIHPEPGYGPRMERAENLLERILREPGFRGATLGGCIFAIDPKNERLWIRKE